MVLISKQFEVKATVDGMSLRFPFRVCRGLQHKSIGMHSKKKYVESVRRVSPKMKYLGDFLTKDVATRELEPAKSASSCRSGIQHDASYCLRRFHVRLITGLLRQKSIPPDGLVNSVFL